MLLLAGCSDATLFRSNFDETAIDQPPAGTPGVGTAALAGPPGSVLVVAAPAGLNGKWLRLRRPNADTGFPEPRNSVAGPRRGPLHFLRGHVHARRRRDHYHSVRAADAVELVPPP